VGHGPLERGQGCLNAGLIKVPQRQQGDDTLRNAMNIDRVRVIVEIFGCAIFTEEVLAVKFEPSLDIRFKF